MTHLGIDPAKARLLVLKSAQHYAGAFGPLAKLILRAQTDGACPQDPARHPYTKLVRPFWPIDEEVTGRLVI
jgi:microcystin degradation protein MlrC